MRHAQADLARFLRVYVVLVGDFSAVKGKPLCCNRIMCQYGRHWDDGFVSTGDTDTEIAQKIAPFGCGSFAEGECDLQNILSLFQSRNRNCRNSAVNIKTVDMGLNLLRVPSHGCTRRVLQCQMQRRGVKFSCVNFAVDRKAEPDFAGDRFFRNQPRLRCATSPRFPTKALAQKGINTQKLLCRGKRVIIQCVFRHIQKEDIRFRKFIGNCGKIHRERRFCHRRRLLCTDGFFSGHKADQQAVMHGKHTGKKGVAAGLNDGQRNNGTA
ncbi:unknown [Clostridium sp. CAG:448]|nr:unknown [Clostridium sp. CAG:448]